MDEKLVTFTVLEDGMFLPSIGAVLPEGEYRGRVIRDAGGQLVDVVISLNRRLLDQLGLDKGGGASLNWSIIRDYREGLVREDRV